MLDPVHVPRCHSRRARTAIQLFLYASLALAGGTSPAIAVLLITGNGNTTAPAGSEDPGFAHVGERSSQGETLIYLGNGWVITANHVKVEEENKHLLLGGIVYPHVPGSIVQFVNDDLSPADLKVFQVSGAPALPDLPVLEIASVSPAVGTSVIMIGRGYNQGPAVTWMGRQGWEWGGFGGAIRWGTNQIANPTTGPPSGPTDQFIFDFTKPGDFGVTTHEGQSTTGDSGGAVFARKGGTGHWELAGVMFASASFVDQPPQTAVNGNLTYSADLARFRDQIIPLVRPDCSDEVDNDGDGRVDYPEDPGCSSRESHSEIDALPSLGRPAAGLLGALLIAVSLLMIPGTPDATAGGA